ncbi:Mpv17-like protein [Amphibalanus amphitrite]|uniref:Mpv17-like protein n=1 Tax=Amphibalanus amphitrite TaxID=1232801 RepID=A0A6A4WHI0_AMPAM|nr:Mpv17-like protein [Amphibalanus amphitrite]
MKTTMSYKLVKNEKKKPEPLDSASVARYCVLGYAIAPPLLYAWYKWLDSRFMGVTMRVVSKKVFLDVAVAGPVDVFIFFYSMAVMEQREDKMEEIREKYIPTVLKQVYFWVPAQLINFLFLPPSVRVAFVGVCSFLWINILCWVKREPPGYTASSDGAEASLMSAADSADAEIY